MTTTVGPCAAWEPLWVCDVSCESPTVTAQAARLATDVVWALSGRRFGLCTVTLRPCRRDCATEYPWGWTEWRPGSTWEPHPALIGGRWFNVICGDCGETCSCARLSEVTLPAPVHRVIEVKVDGAPVVTGGYRLDDSRTLVRLGGAEWPRCNDLTLTDTEVGTWSVTAEYGVEVPEGGRWAVGELACHLLRAFRGEDCRLPQNVTRLVRQGVTIEFPTITELFQRGLTGLYLVDLFVKTWNPEGLRRRSQTYRVDGARHRRVGT